MLQPNQFQVDEAWIAFKLNDDPIRTAADGDFDFLAVMDAASCLILSSTAVSTHARQPSREQARRLLEEARLEHQVLPKTLFIPADLAATELELEAQTQQITAVRVPIDQLLLFVGEARQGFRERFGAGDAM
ncbi:MAG: hypothetical protein ABI564_11790 [Ideonella sp.]